jgi:phosphoribosyl 1,2-cyclic phosphate phosphodiesterase
MTGRGEERSRSSFAIEGRERILVDCGPDFRLQARKNNLKVPDYILITHGHGDHFLGLDDLLAYKRSMPEKEWTRIPVYATVETWAAMERRFDYLIGSLIEKRVVRPNERIEGPNSEIIPFKTFHGPSAQGSVGYYMELEDNRSKTSLVYTSDFSSINNEPDFLTHPDALIIQSHWMNEPVYNRPNHMSLQMAIPYIKKWGPKRAVFLIHLSDADRIPGDPWNICMKKIAAADPLKPPGSDIPYSPPLCQADWEELARLIKDDFDIEAEVIAPYDGLRVSL